MIKYPIGIDIGLSHLSAVQLQRKGKGLAIRGLYYHELKETAGGADPSTDDAIIACLQDIAKNKQFSGKSVVLNIPSKDLSIFPLFIQVGPEETLEDAILRESEKYLPFPLEDAIIDYPSLIRDSNGAPGNCRVTIVAVRQSTIDSYLSLMREAGLVVEAVDFAVSSLLRLHQYARKATRNPIILCHIGHTKTLLAAVTKDGILVQSDVTWGSRSLITSILSNIDLSHDVDSARVLLKKYGLVFDHAKAEPDAKVPAQGDDMIDVQRTIFQIIAPYVDEILYELHKIISHVRSENQNFIFDGLFLYGQASGINHLAGYLEKRLNIPTKIVDPLTDLATTGNNVAFRDAGEGMFAVALGLAMRRMPWL